MSNLGGYQRIVQTVKALGGPKKAAAIAVPAVAFAGYGILRGIEAGVKKGVTASKATTKKRSSPCQAKNQVFDVISDGEAGDGPALRAGDRYRVLEGDAEAICIEVLGAPDNPHFVSGAFLRTVSDFPPAPHADGDGVAN